MYGAAVRIIFHTDVDVSFFFCFFFFFFFLDPLRLPEGSYIVGSAYPSVLQSVHLSILKLRMTEPDFPGKFFLPKKNWENGPKMGQKQGVFNLLENLVINFY